MTTQQMNLLAVISIAVCWCAFVATWAAAANYNEGRARQNGRGPGSERPSCLV